MCSHTHHPSCTSRSYPPEIQLQMLRTMAGLAHCDMVHPGYSVEYDYVDPRSLFPTLMTQRIRRLFLAGALLPASRAAGGLQQTRGLLACACLRMCGNERRRQRRY